MLNAYEAFLRFLEEFADFFELMVEDEQDKLDALLSYELGRIEQAISIQQASYMKLSNMEKKRMELQKQAGFDGMTFREIIAACDEGQREALQELFDRIESAIDSVKYYNGESMDLVRLNLQAINAAVPEIAPQGYTSDRSQPASSAGAASIFETKI